VTATAMGMGGNDSLYGHAGHAAGANSGGVDVSTDSIGDNIAVDTADWQCSFIPAGGESCWDTRSAAGAAGAGSGTVGDVSDWVEAAAEAEGCLLVHSRSFQMLSVELQVRSSSDFASDTWLIVYFPPCFRSVGAHDRIGHITSILPGTWPCLHSRL
jgi:hypothetical protein